MAVRDPYAHATHFELSESMSDHYFGRLNQFLFVILLCLATYIMLSPFYAEFGYTLYQIQHRGDDKSNIISSSHASESATMNTFVFSKGPIPKTNNIVIPKIGVDTPILEGKSALTLNDGLWRRPKTSTPDLGGNTVITGHRFMYSTGNKTFYHLDKLAVGDPITVYWKGRAYGYRVTSQKVVAPTEISIEEPTTDERLTLYTCTPLWTSKNRLVITAAKVAEQ